MVYVGEVFKCLTLPGHSWMHDMAAHLEADTESELDAFAEGIGLRSDWKQPPNARHPWPHYDVTANKRCLAIRRGAVAQTNRECADRWKQWRKERGKS